MKNTYTLLLVAILLSSSAFSQFWKATGAREATGQSFYLIAAAAAGDNIFVVHANNNLGYSTDLGKSWSMVGVTKPAPNGSFAGLAGVKNRLYASMKVNNDDYELYYTTNNAKTWTIDTIGMPINLVKTGKSAMIMIYMENDYVLAHNYLKAVYKRLDDIQWTPTTIDHTIVDVAATTQKWLAIGAEKILQSVDNGTSWTPIITTGLPDNFQGLKICSNGTRFYVCNAPATGGEDIYASDDGGSSWILLNSAGKMNYPNPWINNMYAVDEYLFAAITPKAYDFNTPPPFIFSSTPTPNFVVGDVSGFEPGTTVSSLPFFFHAKNKLFTMFGDLYVSEPGFTGSSASSVPTVTASDRNVTVYPNPGVSRVQIASKNSDNFELGVYDVQGKRIYQQQVHTSTEVDVSTWGKGLYVVKSVYQNGTTEHVKFFKQ